MPYPPCSRKVWPILVQLANFFSPVAFSQTKQLDRLTDLASFVVYRFGFFHGLFLVANDGNRERNLVSWVAFALSWPLTQDFFPLSWGPVLLKENIVGLAFQQSARLHRRPS